MGCTQVSRETSVDEEAKTGAPRPKPGYGSEAEAKAAEARRDCLEGLLVTKSITEIPIDATSSYCKSANSQVGMMNSEAMFHTAQQTIIIFDWDDTICPSSAIRRYSRFDNTGKLLTKLEPETLERLEQLQDQAKALLERAMELGKVVLVTNAKRPWVDISCNAFMPALKEIMQDIPKIYAVELLSQDGANLAGKAVLTETKHRAMRAAVTGFYSRYPNQSWKNIMSIGDALFEHTAIRQVVGEHMRDSPTSKKCRTKTLKLLDGPTISGLAIQLRIVYMWLRKMVEADDDVDIDFSADENKINGWRATFSSEDNINEICSQEPPNS